MPQLSDEAKQLIRQHMVNIMVMFFVGNLIVWITLWTTLGNTAEAEYAAKITLIEADAKKHFEDKARELQKKVRGEFNNQWIREKVTNSAIEAGRLDKIVEEASKRASTADKVAREALDDAKQKSAKVRKVLADLEKDDRNSAMKIGESLVAIRKLMENGKDPIGEAMKRIDKLEATITSQNRRVVLHETLAGSVATKMEFGGFTDGRISITPKWDGHFLVLFSGSVRVSGDQTEADLRLIRMTDDAELLELDRVYLRNDPALTGTASLAWAGQLKSGSKYTFEIQGKVRKLGDTVTIGGESGNPRIIVLQVDAVTQ